MHTPTTIAITNLSNNHILTYPLAILTGTITPHTSQVHISTSTPTIPFNSHPVVSTHFTALYLLNPGPNLIALSSTSSTLSTSPMLTLTLIYKPPTPSAPFVRLVYLLAADSDGSFYSPDPPPFKNIASATKRLQTAGWMIQAATAEMMHAHGFNRRTFTLAPAVHVHKLTDLYIKDALNMSGSQLWSHTAQALHDLPRRNDSIDIAIISFTTMQHGKVKAHTALGGRRLAIFGSGSMFTWPVDVNEVGSRLRDTRQFDSTEYFDDSAGRAMRMGRRACAATTIGALLYELGHCLSLPHPTGEARKRGGGIMARGFDYLDRLFLQPKVGEEVPFWDRGSAVRLRYHQFLMFEGEMETRGLKSLSIREKGEQEEDGPKFVKMEGRVVCRSEAGIGHVGYYKNGDNASHEEFNEEDEPKDFQLPCVKEIRRRCGMSATDRLVVSIIDVEGRIKSQSYDEI